MVVTTNGTDAADHFECEVVQNEVSLRVRIGDSFDFRGVTVEIAGDPSGTAEVATLYADALSNQTAHAYRAGMGVATDVFVARVGAVGADVSVKFGLDSTKCNQHGSRKHALALRCVVPCRHPEIVRVLVDDVVRRLGEMVRAV